jgi:hypothetical protein
MISTCKCMRQMFVGEIYRSDSRPSALGKREVVSESLQWRANAREYSTNLLATPRPRAGLERNADHPEVEPFATRAVHWF